MGWFGVDICSKKHTSICDFPEQNLTQFNVDLTRISESEVMSIKVTCKLERKMKKATFTSKG